jgi:hypothetical protein
MPDPDIDPDVLELQPGPVDYLSLITLDLDRHERQAVIGTVEVWRRTLPATATPIAVGVGVLLTSPDVEVLGAADALARLVEGMYRALPAEMAVARQRTREAFVEICRLGDIATVAWAVGRWWDAVHSVIRPPSVDHPAL